LKDARSVFCHFYFKFMNGESTMRLIPVLFRVVAGPLLSAAVIFSANSASAQESDVQQKPTVVKTNAYDKTEAQQSTLVYRKAWAGHKPAAVPESKLIIRGQDKHGDSSGDSEESNNTVRYPGDLSYHGGKVVEVMQSHDIYLLPGGRCSSPSCYGDPERFLRALGKSEFMHVTDQYVDQHSSNRYTLGQNFSLAFTISTTPLTDLDVQAIVHAAAAVAGTGYTHMYHVFIPPGQDECFDSTFTICASNVFCAYHSSVDFGDIGHVLYSVEPFAEVFGCTVRPGTPNGTLMDSTNNVLSHELVETITDPDGDAWWNSMDRGLGGEEIGDECAFVIPPGISFDPSIISVKGHSYALQPEYDNSAHGCSAYQ
jgi:hypothetical protein